MLKLCDSELFQVQVLSCLYSVWSVHTNVCLDLTRSEDIPSCKNVNIVNLGN